MLTLAASASVHTSAPVRVPSVRVTFPEPSQAILCYLPAMFCWTTALQGFVLMCGLGIAEAYRQPVFDPGMVQAAPIAGLIVGCLAGIAAPPVRWLRERLQARRWGARFLPAAWRRAPPEKPASLPAPGSRALLALKA